MLPAAGVDCLYHQPFSFFACLKHDTSFFFRISLFRDVRQMLLKLVELRSSDWGRVRDAVAASNATPDNDPNYFMVRVVRAAGALLLVFVSHRLFFPLSEWTHLLHRGWRSFYSSRPRWDHNRPGPPVAQASSSTAWHWWCFTVYRNKQMLPRKKDSQL